MVQMAFWHDEIVVVSTLENIARDVDLKGIKPPATLVVGKVVHLHEKLKKAHRDLRRRPDGSSRFEPAPAPDQLLRLATAGLGSQVLGFCLERKLFDYMETPKDPTEISLEQHLDVAAVTEILDVLVALGVLERDALGYRNLELASRYLRSDSPQSLRSALLHQTAQPEWPCGWHEGLLGKKRDYKLRSSRGHVTSTCSSDSTPRPKFFCLGPDGGGSLTDPKM